MSNNDKGLGSPLEKLEKLQKAEAQVLQLREEFEKERRQQLEQLHLMFGFASREELVQALQALGGPRRRGRPQAGSGPGDAPAGGRTSKRARITPEMQAGIIKALRAGERGVAVAARFGISGLSLHKIKKAAGLVRRSKK